MRVQLSRLGTRHHGLWLIPLAPLFAFSLPVAASLAQIEESSGQEDRREVAEDSDADSAELGVIVAPSPGTGVLVTGTIWGGPAERAGIRLGDYILSVDGEKVSTPAELEEAIRAKQPGSKVRIVIWRRGNEIVQELKLATRADDSPAKKRAWLGVVLQPQDETGVGVRIDRVFPGSPADRAGLQRGDLVERMDDKEVTSVEMIIDLVEDLEPKAKSDLLVRRGDTELQVTVTLGAADTAPWQWLRDAFRIPSDGFEWRWEPEEWEQFGARGIQSLEDKLEYLQQELERLREKLDKSVDESSDSTDPPASNGNPGHNSGVQARVYRPYTPHYTYRTPRPYSYNYAVPRYYSVPPVPYQYYYHRGRPYVYRGPYSYGMRFGVRIGPYGVEYWY